MPKFLTSVDLTKNQLLNAAIQNLGTAPSSPALGQIYYNTADNKLYVYNGSSWLDATSATRLKGSSGATAAYTSGDLNLVGGSNVTVTQVGSTFTFDVSIPSSTIAFTGDVNDVSSSTGVTTTLTLKNTGVAAGTYGTSNTVYPFTVNAKGLITNVGAGVSVQPYDEDLTQIAGLSGTSGLLKKTGANTWTLDTTAYGTGTVTSVGLSLPNIFSTTGTPVTTAGTFSVSLSNQNANLIFAGPSTGAASAPIFRSLVAADLPNTTVSANSYGSTTQVATFTVDAQGRLTAASNTTIAGATISGGDISTYFLAPGNTAAGLTLTTTGVGAGTYKSVTVDAKGRVTAGTNPTTLAGYGITDALDTSATGQTKAGSLAATGGFIGSLTGNASTASALQTARAIAHSGDITGSANFDGSAGITIAMTLATVNSSVGSFGGATQVPSITVNGKGLVTAVSNTSIAAATLSGDISTVTVTPGSSSTITLNTVNSNTGSFGSASAIPVITVNGKGLITGVTTVAPRIDSLNDVTAVGATTSSAITINNTTQSTSTGSGALIVAGGLGVAKDAYFGGALTIAGNLNIGGTLYTTGVSTLVIDDAILYVANGNVGNVADIGIVGHFDPGSSYQHTGLVRRAADGLWYLFSGVTTEPGVTINFATYTTDTLKANIQGNVTGNLTGLASRATNVDGGAAGSIPYQTGVSTTGFVAAGTSGTFLKSQGTSAPIWTSVTKSDVGLSNVENTALSTWTGSTYITTVASNLSLSGSPTTTTAAAGTSSTVIATTGFVSNAVTVGTSTLASKTGKYATNIGNGASTSIIVNHALNSQDVVVTVRETASPYNVVYPDVQMTDANNVTIVFGTAPSANAYRVIVVG